MSHAIMLICLFLVSKHTHASKQLLLQINHLQKAFSNTSKTFLVAIKQRPLTFFEMNDREIENRII